MLNPEIGGDRAKNGPTIATILKNDMLMTDVSMFPCGKRTKTMALQAMA